MAAHEFHQLHLRPEVVEVEGQASQYDEAQYEHVLRGPRYTRFLDRHLVALRAARAVVVQRQHDRIDEVQRYDGCQARRRYQRIPIRAQQRADYVVGFRREERRQVHGHVEQDEEHQHAARDAHHQFLAHRGVAKKTVHRNNFVIFVMFVLPWVSAAMVRGGQTATNIRIVCGITMAARGKLS